MQTIGRYHMPNLSHLKTIWTHLEDQYTSDWAIEMMPYLKRGVRAFYDIDMEARSYICSLYLKDQKIEDQDDFIAHMHNPGKLLNDLLHATNQPAHFEKLLKEIEHGVRLNCESTLSALYYEMRALMEDF